MILCSDYFRGRVCEAFRRAAEVRNVTQFVVQISILISRLTGARSGKRVLHLQCDIGRDTLCLVRRGAVATGLDFSGVALDVAHRLSGETGLKADFVQGTVDEARCSTPYC
jgi:2-polyprenyl-3-methyl-5-hydroxy-6-metoxy-1,4-benzoquinol methylase